MKELIRKVLLALFIVIITFGAFKFIMGFKKEPQINELVESIKLVKIQKVKLDTNQLSIPVYGNLRSLDEIELFPEVGGRLMSSDFREGRSYQKGEVIAYIENSELSSNIKSQKSNLLNQVAKLVADLKFDFPDDVAAWENFLSNIEFDKPLPELPAVNNPKLKNYLAGKNLYNNYFAIQSQEDRLAKYTIVAPFSGILTEAVIKPGTVMRVGQKIGKFINPTEFELEASVQLTDGSKIKSGDRVSLRSNDISGVWQGRVDRINRSLNESSQNMEVFIRVSSSTVFNGMYLFGEIEQSAHNSSIEIPRNLISKGVIFSVVDGKLKSIDVEVLQTRESSAIIAGVGNGTIILAEPVKDAFDGMKVRYN